MSQEKEDLIVERQRNDQVVILRFNRPEAQNRSNYKMKEKLADIYEALLDDPTVRVLVLTGTGAYYAAGGQVNLLDPEEKRRFEVAHARVLNAQQQLRIPIIVAINGDILGGAAGDMMIADYSVAVESARFGFPQITRNSFPISLLAVSMQYLPQKFALEAFYTGRLYPMTKALELGLINKITTPDKLWEEVNQFIDAILIRPKEIISIGRNAYFSIRAAAQKDRMAIAEQFMPVILAEETRQKRK